jgi:hypothetical protein
VTRRWVWLQLLIVWTPVWALFVTLLLTAHRDVSPLVAVLIGARLIAVAFVLGLVVQRLTLRVPWPHPMRFGFIALHALTALAFAASWIVLNSLIESIRQRELVLIMGAGLGPFLVTGVWLYVMIAGVTYSAQAAERAARIEAAAARAQLSALRAQLNPHFLFNALHTVVQLIPSEPRRAARAAEQLAALLRATIQQRRDTVTLADEWGFVERYLELERLRFAERLEVRTEWSENALACTLPSFTLQTLVENAVRHGASPRVAPTRVTIEARASGGALHLIVSDDGEGTTAEALASTDGTGLARLRERLGALYGSRARLDVTTRPGAGFSATLTIPQGDDGGRS